MPSTRNVGIGWIRLNPAIDLAALIALLTAVMYFAGYKSYEIYFSLLGIPKHEVEFTTAAYLLAGFLPALVVLVPVTFGMLLRRENREELVFGPRAMLGNMPIIWPVLLLSVTHIHDKNYSEAIGWSILLIGYLFLPSEGLAKIRKLRKAVWISRIAFVLMLALASSHLGASFGRFDAQTFDTTAASVQFEFEDTSHSLQNKTLLLILHHNGNYYVRSGEDPPALYVVPDSIVQMAKITSSNTSTH